MSSTNLYVCEAVFVHSAGPFLHRVQGLGYCAATTTNIQLRFASYKSMYVATSLLVLLSW